MSEPARSGRRGAAALLLVLLAALPFALYPQYLSTDRFLYSFDAGQSHYARFRIIGETLRDEGGLALWQTRSYAGSPFHANLENPTLYPPIVLAAALLPPILALNLTVLVHLSLSMVGMFLLVRRLWRRIEADTGGALTGATVAAVLFGLNAFHRLDSFNLVGYGAAMALIPWIFLALDAVLHGPAPRRATAALVVLAAAQVFTGGLFNFAYTFLAAGVWALLLGVGGAPEARRRAVTWLPVAGLLVALLVLARLLPFLEWVQSTNRGTALSPEDAKGFTLAGVGVFRWRTLAMQLGNRTHDGLLVLLALPALAIRRRVARVVLALALLGIVASSGVLHDVLLGHVPPFNSIRGAFRAWVLADAFLPVAAGLGLSALLARWPLLARVRVADPLLALAAAALLLPPLLDTGRHQAELEEPESFAQTLTLYPHWHAAAAAVGADWRTMSLDVQEPGTRNEQFIAVALGAETPAGFFGFAYPRALARHLYDETGALSPERRLRRAGILSVGAAVYSEGFALRNRRWDDRLRDPYPGGIDGTQWGRIEGARPRAFLPARVAGLAGDPDGAVLYALLDAPSFEILRTSLVAVTDEPPFTDAELHALDALCIVEPVDAALEAQARALGVPVHRVLAPLDAAAAEALAAELCAPGGRASASATFERASSRDVRVVRAEADAPRWAVLSETWSLYGGWVARAGGREAPVRGADGVASAVLLLPGEAELLARYEPASVRAGLWLAGLGLLGTLALLLLPRRRS